MSNKQQQKAHCSFILCHLCQEEVVEEALPSGGALEEVVDVALEGVAHPLLAVVDLPEVRATARLDLLLLQYLGVCNRMDGKGKEISCWRVCIDLFVYPWK